ncbi:hypothetical protein VSWAT3_25784 [Vibrionales bacterium SWAT-3]|nr:hypothetical protein VSWAT3_25784 [Vibrionales bacterium SWAT-3]
MALTTQKNVIGCCKKGRNPPSRLVQMWDTEKKGIPRNNAVNALKSGKLKQWKRAMAITNVHSTVGDRDVSL